jgi:hypothetical protein
MDRPLVQRFRTEYGVSEYDLETSKMRRPKPARAVEPKKKKKYIYIYDECIYQHDYLRTDYKKRHNANVSVLLLVTVLPHSQ